MVLRFLYQEVHQPRLLIAAGFYDVIQANMPDSIRWQNIAFDNMRNGSFKANDKRFNQRYGRGYFAYKLDSAKQLIAFRHTNGDSTNLAEFTYTIKDSVLVELTSDSMHVLLRRRTVPFGLAEKQFHWVSETNR